MAGITRLGLSGISRPRYGNFGLKQPRPVAEAESGASTESEFVKRFLREQRRQDYERERETARQRALNRQARARQAAEEAAKRAETEKPAVKREAKRLYRALERGPEPDAETFGALVESVGRFAPRARDNLALPPERAVKFDRLVADTEALQAIYEAHFAQVEREMTAEENALLGVFLLAA